MYKVYQVQMNDTLEKIAETTGTTAQELANLNGLKEITVGQLLVVPNQERVFDIYTVVKGDNMYELSKKFNLDLGNLLKLNGLDKDDYIYPGQEILIPREGILTYVTEEEETLDGVADKLGVNRNDLLDQNKTVYLTPDQLIIYRK